MVARIRTDADSVGESEDTEAEDAKETGVCRTLFCVARAPLDSVARDRPCPFEPGVARDADADVDADVDADIEGFAVCAVFEAKGADDWELAVDDPAPDDPDDPEDPETPRISDDVGPTVENDEAVPAFPRVTAWPVVAVLAPVFAVLVLEIAVFVFVFVLVLVLAVAVFVPALAADELFETVDTLPNTMYP